jgi:hypothetical protein
MLIITLFGHLQGGAEGCLRAQKWTQIRRGQPGGVRPPELRVTSLAVFFVPEANSGRSPVPNSVPSGVSLSSTLRVRLATGAQRTGMLIHRPFTS